MPHDKPAIESLWTLLTWVGVTFVTACSLSVPLALMGLTDDPDADPVRQVLVAVALVGGAGALASLHMRYHDRRRQKAHTPLQDQLDE